MEQLNKKAVTFFFVSYASRLLFFLIALSGLVISMMIENNLLHSIGMYLFIGILLLLIIIFVSFCYIWSRLTYRFFKYELSDIALKIEKGVIYKKYISIPYERIQNVDIYRGLLSRILGLSDVHIQTAGYGSSVSKRGISTEGRLPALDPKKAEELREKLIQQIRGTKQGL